MVLVFAISNFANQAELLMLMTILTQTFLAFVRSHLMSLVFLTVWHSTLVLLIVRLL